MFVDFEGFYTNDGSCIIKELAAISLTDESDTPVLKIFEPPAEYNNEVKSLETKDLWLNTHGIEWEEGSTSYTNLKEVLLEMVKNKLYIYVLGEKKKQWLDKVMGWPFDKFIRAEFNAIDLTKMRHADTLSSFDPSKLCLFKEKHSKPSGYACAFETVQRMKSWYLSSWGLEPSPEKSLQLFYHLKNLMFMDAQDIGCLDKEFILTYASKQIEVVWPELPSHMQTDPRFIGFTRCHEHYNNCIEDGDVFDGPNPYKNQCTLCNI